MKRSWPTYLIIASVAGLILVLGGLQYRWLHQISESEGEKARARVHEQADRFAMDFNREIQNAYFNLQTDASGWKNGDWTAFNERYDFWLKNAAHPELISEVWFIDAAGASSLRYEKPSRSFVPATSSEDIALARARAADQSTFSPIDIGTLSLVLPVHESGHRIEKMIMRSPDAGTPPVLDPPHIYGYLILKLDPATVNNTILPELKAKYFGDGEFTVAVTGPTGESIYGEWPQTPADASASLLDLAPDDFLFFSNKDLMKTIGAERHQSMMVNSHVESRTFNRVQTGETGGTFKIEVKKDSEPSTTVFTTTARTTPGDHASPWTLQVQHISGSLDSFIASTLRRNLAIGLGILFLLAGAILAIIISSVRARNLAQRQLDFVSSVSHEFRTPLAVIYSAGENLEDGIAKDRAQISRYGNLIKGEGRKLSTMVEQILDFAGANSGKRKFNFTEVSVTDLVKAAVAECSSVVDDQGFDIETAIADDLPVIRGDKAALGQAIQNLIANSIKYCNGDGWMRVTAGNGDGRVRIAVEDRGIGISKADLRHIFEPFFRSKQVVDAQIHGNGLGLSLVKQIVEAHGGTVKAVSEAGRGSKFTIELPQALSR